jgi:hypothetical protein
MSDILKQFDLNKFKYSISLSTEHCLSYVRKASVSEDEIVLTIGMRVKMCCWLKKG